MKALTVSRIADNLWGIRDTQTPEDTMCYLVCGSQKALLFDTGIGLGGLLNIVADLTSLPVITLLSHWHHDHTGAAHTFNNVWAWPSRRMSLASTHGISTATIRLYEDKTFFESVGSNTWSIPAFPELQFLQSGQAFDLGGYNLKVLHTPGHTKDSICLYEPKHGWLFTGDTVYNGPILLKNEESSLMEYTTSISQLSRLPIKTILPGHNATQAQPLLFAAILKLLKNPKSKLSDFPTLSLVM